MQRTPTHWIGPNEAARVPSRHVILDTEARFDHIGPAQLQSWRCGVAEYAVRSNHGKWTRERREYVDPVALWTDVAAFTRARKRTVVWAHNLAYDLRVSRALLELPTLGFTLVDIRLATQGTWARFDGDGRPLVLVDSASVWPQSLETLGGALGLGKPPLPDDDNPRAWMDRCRADVDILSRAVISYLDWLRAGDLGSWQLTGAGQAWSHWRHRHYTHRVLVDDNEARRVAERRAIWGGRAEAWTYGADPRMTVYDYDWVNAYPRIACEVDVPVKPWSVSRNLRFDRVLALADRYAVLAQVEVEVDAPVVPCELDGRIVWPVGQFRTTLWDPELRLLAEAGATVRTGNLWFYRKAPALAEWADWVMTHMHCPNDCHPAHIKTVIKHWSRALIGRFAMRYRQWEPFAVAPTDDLRVIEGWNLDADVATYLLQVGRQVLAAAGEVEGEDAAPMITGYVSSAARAKLWRAIELIGADHVLYTDTDSLILDHRGHLRAQRLLTDPLLAGLRLKRRFRGYDIAGPRQLVLAGEPRLSGVPRTARRVGERTWEGEVWRGLGESIRHGESDRVRVTTRTFHIRYVDRRRVRGRDGRTRPIELPLEIPAGEQETEEAS